VLLDLLAGDLADLVVREIVANLLLAVRDGRREHAEGAQTHLVARAHRGGDLLTEL
jgi:hypothetical protein